MFSGSQLLVFAANFDIHSSAQLDGFPWVRALLLDWAEMEHCTNGQKWKRIVKPDQEDHLLVAS